MNWIMLLMRKPKFALISVVIAACVGFGFYIRDLSASLADAERRAAETLVQRDAAIDAASEAVLKAKAAAASEQKATAELNDRLNEIATAQGTCLDIQLPAGLWEVE